MVPANDAASLVYGRLGYLGERHATGTVLISACYAGHALAPPLVMILQAQSVNAAWLMPQSSHSSAPGLLELSDGADVGNHKVFLGKLQKLKASLLTLHRVKRSCILPSEGASPGQYQMFRLLVYIRAKVHKLGHHVACLPS